MAFTGNTIAPEVPPLAAGGEIIRR